ncbi:hypothetical protein CYMTET_50508 [Cymbomonas tetramitiformis]|uniref:Pirin n=1 Tax=Cymbomonas tetramitiformis TaxID=36881 RepID=A0AAE0ET35_9CHLO|nr:hypothetical protein CYMTET_50508 [Cymbomonas tetramitiformis]|eukprot:gene4699-5753_t
MLDFFKLNDLAARLEHAFGGRVCPMSFTPEQTDPFVLCVHHRHSFWSLDPIRPIFRLLLPEGFPAHPHRGFETVTYVLKGALAHRDSTGVKQVYGADCVQWMTAGFGMLHEEMWQTADVQHELYQIWVNLPAHAKLNAPAIQMLGQGDFEALDRIPVHSETGCEVRVLSGDWHGHSSPVRTSSPVNILHATVQPGATFTHELPADFTCIVYVRKGEAVVHGNSASTAVPTFSTAFLARGGEVVEISCAEDAREPADFLMLAGQPLREPVVASGSMVMNSDIQIQQAYSDYQRGLFGIPWDHKLSDDEWKSSLRKIQR